MLLYEGTEEEVRLLRSHLGPLMNDVGLELVISDLPFIESRGGFAFRAHSSYSDEGVKSSGLSPGLDWNLRPESWRDVGAFLEPFCKPTEGTHFQYLSGSYAFPIEGPEIVYSTDRSW